MNLRNIQYDCNYDIFRHLTKISVYIHHGLFTMEAFPFRDKHYHHAQISNKKCTAFPDWFDSNSLSISDFLLKMGQN